MPRLTLIRASLLATLGLLGTLALFVLLAPQPSDPLRMTAALLPLLVAGCAALRDRARSAASSGRGLRLAVLGAVGVWGVLAVGWRHLTLPHTEPVVAAAGALLLAGWLALELPGLLRRLAGAGSALPPRVFFLLPLLVYLSVLPWTQSRHLLGGDEPYYLLVAHSIAYDGDIDLANNYAGNDASSFMSRPLTPQKDDPVEDEGQVYSRHSPAVPLLLAPAYRLGGSAGAAIVMMAMAAAVAWAGLALARELHPRRHRGQLFAWLALALASPLALYSYRFWGEVPPALCLTLACALILRRSGARDRSTGYMLGIAALLAFPVLVKTRFALVAAPLAVLAWWRAGRRWQPAVAVGAALLAAGLAMVALNLAHFDQLLGTRAIGDLNLLRYPVGRWFSGAAGQLLDGAFGLAGAYPIWLLLLPALAVTVKRSRQSRWLLSCWVPYLLVLLPRSNAFSQFSPPFRYALAALPLLAACLVPAFEDRRASVRLVVRALAALTLVLAILWIVQPAWTVHRVTGSTHLIDRLELLTHTDFGRLFPSYMRVRTAAWAWAAAVLLLAACWRWWPRGRRGSSGLAAPLLLVLVSCTAWAAGHAPTRTVEFEDRWLDHGGGVEWPDPWKPWAQPRAWRLAPGESIRIPLISGGPVLQPSLRLGRSESRGQPIAFELVADDGRVLRRWSDRLDASPFWQWRTLPAMSLPLERPVGGLTIRAVEPAPGDDTAVLLDRAKFDWLAAPAR